MKSFRARTSVKGGFAMTLLIALAVAVISTGCRQRGEDAGETGGFSVRSASDCLPDITLLDQHGQRISLSSLKGKPALFDFIYTSCPGECLLLTERMKRIAKRLGPALGSQVRFISITVDPEHDQPQQLLAYADSQGANVAGWLFLTGTPEQIDHVMAEFNLIRKREADGTVDHVPEFFLVDGRGHALLQYVSEKANPDRVASDLQQAAAGKPVTTSDGDVVAAGNQGG
jgi:protein SCO1/2